MIKRISITNFQSHKNTELNLSDGVNIISGSSDSGKTAILRAINWLINNRPVGDSFRSYWGGDTTATFEMKDGRIIQRYKDKKSNEYLTSIGREKTEAYKALKTDVPDEIKEILNFDPVNIQMQLDSPFILSNTPGQIAQYLNKIVNLDVIDKSLSNIEKEKREIKREIDYNEQKKEGLLKEIKEYGFLEEFEKRLLSLENKKIEHSQLKKDYTDIYVIIKDIEKQKEELNNIIDIKNSEKNISDLIKRNEEMGVLSKDYDKLKILNTKIHSITEEIQNSTDKQKKLQNQFNDLWPENGICPLCGGKNEIYKSNDIR